MTRREIGILADVERFVRPVRFEPGQFVFSPVEGAPRDLANRLRVTLEAITGQRWGVAISNEAGEPTLAERKAEKKAEEERGVRANPIVRAVLETFPARRSSVSAHRNRPPIRHRRRMSPISRAFPKTRSPMTTFKTRM